MVCIALAQVAGPTVALYARDPTQPTLFLFESFSLRHTESVCDPKAQRINPGRRPDRSGADAAAAIGANDIRPRDGSSGSDHRRNNRAYCW